MSDGSAAISTSTLSVGTHSIMAVYGGDANYDGSTSGPLHQIVNERFTGGGLKVDGARTDGRTATDRDRLVFLVP